MKCEKLNKVISKKLKGYSDMRITYYIIHIINVYRFVIIFNPNRCKERDRDMVILLIEYIWVF